jgi:NhaA family Na+:H+ antiporter
MAGAQTGPTPWWKKDTTPGYLLLATTALSFLLQNGPLGDAFRALLKEPVGLVFAGYNVQYEFRYFVKDALMCVFFLFVGLELKREVMEGPLRNPREAALPMLGAVGGMLAPALLYLWVATQALPASAPEYARGWAIPAATDIAFAVGVLSLLGARVPAGLRLFLLTLAIVDDLGAILIIALFYSGDLATVPIVASVAIVIIMWTLNRLGVRALTPYWVFGVLLWAAMAKSGLSPTLAGVLIAFCIPMRAKDGSSPLLAAEHALKPYVQLGIMPLFALAIAGVNLAGVRIEEAFHPIALGIAAGLAIGKPLGITVLAWFGSKVLRQPCPGTVPQLIGLGMVAGIGFTMSLFVGALAFPSPALAEEVRFGVLGGSLISAALGLLLLSLTLPKTATDCADPNLVREEREAEEDGVLAPRQ